MTSIQVRLLEYGAILLAVILGYAAWHHHVWEGGYQAAHAEQVRAVEEGKKQYAVITQKVEKLPDDRLRHELCEFVRDASLSGCLKSLPPFSP